MIKTPQAGSRSARRQVLWVYAGLLGFNLLAWSWAWTAFGGQPVLLGLALLAYTFGLRHAVDADHIAAIDNVTRKLMQEGRNPLGVGPCFALGHSTVVIVMSTLVAAATISVSGHFAQLKAYGGLVGTCISALFLLLLAVVNFGTFIGVYRTFRAVRRGEMLQSADLDLPMSQRGLLARWFRPLFTLASRSWHLYPIGILFGLGFDTATEIALFGISATQASHGLSLWSLLSLPILFTAGMTLIDTTDGVLMMGAYRWAFVRPIRKIYYNMTITLISVIVAVVIGSVEALALIADKWSLDSPFWRLIDGVAAHFGLLGYGVIAVFLFSWLVSAVIYRCRRYDGIEVRVAP
ncbi:HoxN/HupN/NixA family nickel/cobalt transporter [Frateuria aurantia]